MNDTIGYINFDHVGTVHYTATQPGLYWIIHVAQKELVQ